MEIWLISRTDQDNIDYDEYDASVIAAIDEASALKAGTFMARLDLLEAKHLGTAAAGIEAGVILDSFNAG